jgi:threonine/homoserine/homoserine lactone efflux protein
MTAGTISYALAGLGLGVALAGAPGPVQAVLLAESVRGGIARGFRAMAGANGTFGLLLLLLALGLSVAAPTEAALRVLKVAGGALLVWLAVDGIRSRHEAALPAPRRRALPPMVRGALAVLLNPGAWLFLATAASSLFAAATRSGGTGGSVLAAVTLVIGLAMGDGAVVLVGGLGVRRAGPLVANGVQLALAVLLALVGAWLLVSGVVG